MSLGGSHAQGCDAKASCAGWRMPLAPMALGVLVPALAGATRPNYGLPSPLLSVQASVLGPTCGYCVACHASLLVVSFSYPYKVSLFRASLVLINFPSSLIAAYLLAARLLIIDTFSSVPAPAAPDAAASVHAPATSVRPATSVAPLALGCDAKARLYRPCNLLE
ncbi:hypothetical protein V6N13_116060 [Hibiscus sabdariffa]